MGLQQEGLIAVRRSAYPVKNPRRGSMRWVCAAYGVKVTSNRLIKSVGEQFSIINTRSSPALDSFNRYISKYGIPMNVYMDKHKSCKATAEPSLDDEVNGTRSLSELASAMRWRSFMPTLRRPRDG
jgi:hypothetical protein